MKSTEAVEIHVTKIRVFPDSGQICTVLDSD